jgi:hypothetical protein
LRQPPVREFGFIPLGYSQQTVKGFRSIVLRPGVTGCPGFAGVVQHFQKRREFIFFVEKDELRLRKDEYVSSPGQPFQIRQTFFKRIPVMPEVIRELQGLGDFREKPFGASTLSTPYQPEDEFVRCSDDRLGVLSGLEDEKNGPGRLERLKMSSKGEL